MPRRPSDIHTSAGRWLFAMIVLALFGSALLIDPFADAAFDAPKRLAVMSAAVIGAALLLWNGASPKWRSWSRNAQVIVLSALLCFAGLVLSAVTAHHPPSAWASLRALAVFALFLPIGASQGWDCGQGRWVWMVGAIAVAINALLSLLQAVGVPLPIPIAQLGGRYPTAALLGNEGYVALASALMAAAAFAWALNASEHRQRMLAIVLCVLGVATILINRQLTSAMALGAAMVAILAVRWQRRWIVSIGVGLALFAAAAVVQPSLRSITWSALPVAGVEGYQQLTTYRLGAWAAATEMIRERPLTGFGPGSFALQSQPHRLQAELRLHARLTPPPNANAFVYAHQEYLQLAAEGGIPTALALLVALSVLIFQLLRLAQSPGSPEALALLGIIVTGAVAALAWFPMQIPLTAVLLLLACGRAWRLINDAPERQR
jgi:O-antigen ligase